MLLSLIVLLICACGLSGGAHNGNTQVGSSNISPKYSLYSYDNSAHTSVLTRKGGGYVGENYGIGVASCGEWAFVGSYTDKYHYIDTGAVYVYSLSSAGNWDLNIKLHPSYTSAEVYFGWSLACAANNSLAVGAYGDNSLGIEKAGAVYFFSPSASSTESSGWGETGIFYSSKPHEYEYFGWAVGLSNDLLVVSAIGNGEIYTECGVVYAFKYSAASAEEASRRRRRGLGGEDGTGTGTGTGEDPGKHDADDFSSALPPGWEVEAVISPADPYAYMNFGWSVAVQGQVVVVGAPWMRSRRGVVYIYTRGLTENSAYDDLYYMDEGEFVYSLANSVYSVSLTQDSELFEADTKSYFGYSVAMDGDLLVIGHHLGHSYDRSEAKEDAGGGAVVTRRTGRAFVCRLASVSADPGPSREDAKRTGAGIGTDTVTVTLLADLGETVADRLGEYSFFGYDVSIAGRTVMVGAPGDAHNNHNASVFVFTAIDEARDEWTLAQHWHGAEFAPTSPDVTPDRLMPGRFGIATAIGEEGRLLLASDNHGMSSDYVQTGCVFSWVGVLWTEPTSSESSVLTSSGFWLVMMFGVLCGGTCFAVVQKKRRLRRQGGLDRILGDEDFDDNDESVLMAIGREGAESSNVVLRAVSRVAAVLHSRMMHLSSGHSGMQQLVSIPTDSMHGDSSHHSSSSSSSSSSITGSKSVDVRRLLATAQAVADDDNHPNQEEVAELLRSYSREWINAERFQKEFERLIF